MIKDCFLKAKSEYNRIKKLQKAIYNVQEKLELSVLSKTQPRKFWDHIKKQYTKTVKVSEKLTHGDLYNHFSTLYMSDFPNQDSDIDQHDNIVFDDDLDCPISMSELKKTVSEQNNNKSCGTDGLPAQLFKYCFESISTLLLNPSQTSPGFYVSAVQVFRKHWGKRRNCSLRAISPFPTVFFYPFVELFDHFHQI